MNIVTLEGDIAFLQYVNFGGCLLYICPTAFRKIDKLQHCSPAMQNLFNIHQQENYISFRSIFPKHYVKSEHLINYKLTNLRQPVMIFFGKSAFVYFAIFRPRSMYKFLRKLASVLINYASYVSCLYRDFLLKLC